MKLQEPQEYMPAPEKLRERDKYAKNWKLWVEKHTNRHQETSRDDLKSVNISEWNQRAEEISMANKVHENKPND